MYQVPPKNDPQWRALIKGELNIEFKNFILQLRVTQAQKDVQKDNMEIDQAIEEIHELCEKYLIVVQDDLKSIFK